MSAPRLLPAGPGALLIDLAEPDDHRGRRPADVAADLRALGREEGVVDVVPAASTVLVTFTPEAGDAVRTLVRHVLERVADRDGPAAPAPPVTIRVHYDGADLATVAERCGLTPEEVVARHCAVTYEVEFLGFAPGFAYLRGLDPALMVPRLETPRTRVPAGAVAVAGRYTAVYPRPSPGGWLLLGRTETRLFDLEDSPPARLQAGDRVRFEAAP